MDDCNDKHFTDERFNAAEMAENARARAFFYSLLITPFISLPDTAYVGWIRSENYRSMLESLIHDQALHADIARGAAAMIDFIKSAEVMEETELAQVLGVERTYLYRGLGPNLGPPPPYETVWTTDQGDVGNRLAGLTATYRQSGMTLSEKAMDRPDYIGIELEFLRRLIMEEEQMWSEEQEKALDLVEMQVSFFNDHIGCWAANYIDRALSMVKTDFYRGHLIMLGGFLSDEYDYLQNVLA